MNPVEAISSVFRNYANFSGRAPRSEFWWFYLLSSVLVAILLLIAFAAEPIVGMVFLVIVSVALILPSLAVMVRRLHDTNHSAWWLLWLLLSWIGGLVLLIVMTLPGTQGPNRYGPEPGLPYPPTSVGRQICPQCGMQLHPDARFCIACGTAVPTAMLDERPIIWEQTMHLFFNVAAKAVIGLSMLGFAVETLHHWSRYGDLVWLLFSLGSTGAVAMGLWTYRTARNNPWRFLVYRDRLVAEYAWRGPQTIVSFSDVSSFEGIEITIGQGTTFRSVTVQMVTSSNVQLDVLLNPRNLVACLNERLEQYQRDTGGARRYP